MTNGSWIPIGKKVNDTVLPQPEKQEIPEWVKLAAVGGAGLVIGWLLGGRDDDKQVVIIGGKRYLEE